MEWVESTRTLDDNYEQWKTGDFIIWEEERDTNNTPVQITSIDGYERVFWTEEKELRMTRASNMLRVGNGPSFTLSGVDQHSTPVTENVTMKPYMKPLLDWAEEKHRNQDDLPEWLK